LGYGVLSAGVLEAEAVPGFGDYDAVAGVARVEADLDGEVDADLADEVGERGDVLGALVGDSGDLVAVEEDGGGVGVGVGCGVWLVFGVGFGGGGGVG
jgi:hypothetical protein